MAKKAQKTSSKSSKQEKAPPANPNPVDTTRPAVTNAAVDIPGGGNVAPNTVAVDNGAQQEEQVILTVIRDGETQTATLPKEGARISQGLAQVGIHDTANYKYTTPDGKNVTPGSAMPGNVTIHVEARNKD